MKDETLEGSLGKALSKRKMTIAIAESCTGGLVANRLTNISGSSDYFLMGTVTYSNRSKIDLLGVSERSLKEFGAVSREVAMEMAKGIKKLARSDIGLGITGIAGPTGGTKKKPVGLVYIAVATARKSIVKEFRFRGLRLDIKLHASQAALDLVRKNI
jgi:nicotinamide-nucleotide amidase